MARAIFVVRGQSIQKLLDLKSSISEFPMKFVEPKADLFLVKNRRAAFRTRGPSMYRGAKHVT